MRKEFESAFYADGDVDEEYAYAVSRLESGLIEEAMDLLDAYVKYNPYEFRAYTTKAKILQAIEGQEKAVKYLNSVWNTKKASWDLMLVMAIQYGNIDEADIALKLLKRAEKAGADRADLGYASGIVMYTLTVYGYKGLINKAAKCILEAAKRGKDRIAIESAVANILLSKYHHSNTKDFRLLAQVIEHGEKSIMLGDNDYLTYFNVGRALYYLKNPVGALPNIKMAIEKNPSFVDAHAMLGCVMIDMDDMPKDHYKKAIKIIDVALKEDPSIIFATQSKIKAYDILGDMKGVKKSLIKLTKIETDDVNPLGMLSCIYLAEGNKRKAEECIHTAQWMNFRIPPTDVVFERMRQLNLDWRKICLTDM